MAPYLVQGGGEGVQIDAFVAASSDDRWLVVVRGGALVLVDNASGIERVLPDADVRGEASGSRSIAAFDAGDTHVVYARLIKGATDVAIRTLATQAEREVRLAEGTVWQLQTDPASAWVELTYVRAGAERGPASWPLLVGWLPAGVACRGFDLNSITRSATIASVWLRADTCELRTKRPEIRSSPAVPRDSLASFGANLLSGKPGSYRITNLETGAVAALSEVEGYVGRQARGIVAIDRVILDLETARVLGEVTQVPVAVDAAGRALVPAACGGCEVAIGPLHWERPRLPPFHDGIHSGPLFPPPQ